MVHRVLETSVLNRMMLLKIWHQTMLREVSKQVSVEYIHAF